MKSQSCRRSESGTRSCTLREKVSQPCTAARIVMRILTGGSDGLWCAHLGVGDSLVLSLVLGAGGSWWACWGHVLGLVHG